MTTKSKSIGKWIGEAALVFGSVVGAFYFEDVREDLREKEQYVNILLNLRNDIHDDIYEFRMTSDTTLGNCWACQDTTDLGYIDRFLRYQKGSKDSTNILMMKMSAADFPKWRFPSPYYDEIIKHSDLVERDSIRTSISLYNEIYLSEHSFYEVLNEQSKRNAQLLQRTLDFTDPTSISKIVEIMELRNSMLTNYIISQRAIRNDIRNTADLISIVQVMDKSLAKHGIDTATLDTQWIN